MYGEHFRATADKAWWTMDTLVGLILNVGSPVKAGDTY